MEAKWTVPPMELEATAEPVFEVGEVAEARDPQTLKWRRCWLDTQKPYGYGGPRWHVRWADLPKSNPNDPYYMPSEGGWLSINCIRKVGA